MVVLPVGQGIFEFRKEEGGYREGWPTTSVKTLYFVAFKLPNMRLIEKG